MSERAASYRPPVWAQDSLLALFITAMQVQGTLSRTAAEPATVVRPLADLGHLGFVLLVVGGAVLAVRRRWPVATFLVTAIASLVYYSLDFPDGPGWLGLFVALYTLTALGDGRRSVVVAGVGIGALAGGWLLAATDLEPRAAIGWVFFRIGASVMSAALGESLRTRRVIAVEALARAEVAERTREDVARARVDEERLRIAREVHDTVAHAIAIINVQAGVTAHVLDRRPEQAKAALETIEQTSSRALQEMRTVLGVLHGEAEGHGEGEVDRSPPPGLDQLGDRLGDLAARARDAGLDVALEQTAPTTPVPSAVAGAAYRILQESITNVIRHVGPTRVTVTVDCGDEAVDIRVTDEGRPGGHSPSPDGTGRGIAGMRERCRLLGGHLDAGAVPGGGFEVRARLPLAPPAVVRP